MASVSVDTGYIPGHPGRELQGVALELCDPAQIDRHQEPGSNLFSASFVFLFRDLGSIDQEKTGGRALALDIDGPERGVPISGLAAETAPPTT